MAQARVGSDGIDLRKQKIAAWEKQISVWETMLEKTPAMDRLREATSLSREQITRDIVQRVKTLSFATEADRLDLAKLSGKLDGVESVYYDISDAKQKIEGAKKIIANLVEEIKRAKKGELLETRA